MPISNRHVYFQHVQAIEGTMNAQALHIDDAELYFSNIENQELYLCLRCGLIVADSMDETDKQSSRHKHRHMHKVIDTVCDKLGIDSP